MKVTDFYTFEGSWLHIKWQYIKGVLIVLKASTRNRFVCCQGRGKQL